MTDSSHMANWDFGQWDKSIKMSIVVNIPVITVFGANRDSI